jgi:branched-chain amino acid transport system permease protein
VNVPYKKKDVGLILLLLILPLLFLSIGGYYQWLFGYTYLFVLQGYIAWFLFYKVGQPFFGYGALLGAGAYTTAITLDVYHWSMLPAILLSVCIAAAMSVAMFLATSRHKGFYMGLTSFLLVVLFQKVVSASEISGKSWGIVIKGLKDMMGFDTFYTLMSIAVVACVGIILWIMRTETGKVFTLISENEELTKAVGIYTKKYKFIAYLMVGIMAGFGGSLYVNYITVIAPEDVSMTVTMQIFFIPMIGSPALDYGPLLGAFIMIWLPELFQSIEYYLPILIGISYILVIGFLPEGVGRYLEKYRKKIVEIWKKEHEKT